MKEMKVGTYIRGESTFNFSFYTDLSSGDKLKFVNSVVEILVDESDYNSVIRDLIFDFNVIDIFTDIDITELKDSLTFLDDVEQFLEETNIVEIVKANASPALFDELNKAVNQSVEYRTGIHFNPLNDALTSLISTLEKKIKDIDLNSMMGMAQKFVGMTGELTPESVVNAYINSDVHKKNLDEITEAKKKKTEIAENLDKSIKAVNEEAKTRAKSKK